MSEGLLEFMRDSKMSKPVRRWRLWRCFQDGSENNRLVDAREEIAWLNHKGFNAKIYAPLPEHKTSGHTHVTVLATFDEKCKLAGI